MSYTSEWTLMEEYECPHCGKNPVEYRTWESDDEGHEDYQYRCLDCGHTWWLEGIDS